MIGGSLLRDMEIDILYSEMKFYVAEVDIKTPFFYEHTIPPRTKKIRQLTVVSETKTGIVEISELPDGLQMIDSLVQADSKNQIAVQ